MAGVESCRVTKGVVMDEKWLTVAQVAELLGVKPATVRRWLAEGLLEGVRLPGTRSGWRISQSAVERFLARMKQAGERRDE